MKRSARVHGARNKRPASPKPASSSISQPGRTALNNDNYDFLRRHIARANELAERCADQDIARSLRDMAAESQRVLDALIRTAERRDELK